MGSKKFLGVALFAVASTGVTSAVTLQMQRGWNLIGVPCQVNATTFLRPNLRDKIVVVWKADFTNNGQQIIWKGISPRPQAQQWLIEHGFQRFDHIRPYEGFFIYAAQPFRLSFCEPQIPVPTTPGEGNSNNGEANTINIHGVIFGPVLGEVDGDHVTNRVTWEGLEDLDTHIYFKRDNGQTGHVYFSHMRQDEVRLEEDITTSRGTEVSHIDPVRDDTIYIYAINNYGPNEGDFYGHVSVNVTDGEDSITITPPQGNGREMWVVYMIDHGQVRLCRQNCLFNNENSFNNWLHNLGFRNIRAIDENGKQ